MLKWYYKENYVRMNKSYRSLAPLRFMSQQTVYRRVHSIWLGCSRSLIFSVSPTPSPCVSISYSPWLLAIWSVRILEHGMGFSFSFAAFLLVGCLLFQGHTSCCIHIWNNSEPSTIYSALFCCCCCFFTLNSITRAKHQNAFRFRNNNIDKRNGSDDILCSKVFELLQIKA